MTDPITPPGEYAAIILPDDQALLLPLPIEPPLPLDDATLSLPVEPVLPMLDMEDEA